jgi:NADPH:quinone reductase-like Zn-dependent oxidoreductase
VDTADERWSVKADVVVESVGAATWARSLASLAPGGRLVVCGSTSGGSVEIGLPRLFFKQHEIIGSTMGSYEEFDLLLGLIDEGLPVRVDSVHDIGAYPEALRRMDEGRHLGKIVLDHGVSRSGDERP